MADDINKKITIDVNVNTDGLQQLNQYQTAVSNLVNSVKDLGKPITDASNNIKSLNDDAAKVGAAVGAGIQAVQKGEETKSKTILGSAIQTAAKILGINKTLGSQIKAAD